jgi:hypothetical protein
MWEKWIMLALAIVLVVILFMWNQHDIDCIDEMPCNIMDPDEELVSRIEKMASIPVWRPALITAIIVTIPIVFIYKCDIPSAWDWAIIVPFVFLVSYFSYSWILYHFYQPNAAIITHELREKGL